MENMNPGMKEAAANEPNPISKRRPLTAITAVQALCNKIKSKLVRLMSQEPCLGLLSAGTRVCSVTILISSPQSLSAPSLDAPGGARLQPRSQNLRCASCNLFSSSQSYE